MKYRDLRAHVESTACEVADVAIDVEVSAMVVDSDLVGHGVEPPGFLNPVLYELARTDYVRVFFFDVVDGNNDVHGLGCCYARPGYDTASGLGSIRFDMLAEVLLERAGGHRQIAIVTIRTGTVVLLNAAKCPNHNEQHGSWASLTLN